MFCVKSPSLKPYISVGPIKASRNFRLCFRLTSGKACASLLSVPQVYGLSKSTLGLITMQKALARLTSFQAFMSCTGNWRCFWGIGGEEEYNEYLIRRDSNTLQRISIQVVS